jgi:hypothetical protein
MGGLYSIGYLSLREAGAQRQIHIVKYIPDRNRLGASDPRFMSA